jgi:2'-5' RNA ligase
VRRASARGGGLVRCFVAIELDGGARRALEDLLDRLRSTGADVAWARPEGLHLTLKFLGGVERGRLAALGRRLAAVAAAAEPFVLAVAGCGGFPSLAHPRVLWAGASAPALPALAAGVEEACAAEGFEPETRPFHGHVTLGRVRAAPRGGARRPRRPAAAADAALASARALCRAEAATAFGDVPVDALTLFRSDLAPSGARYTVQARFALGAR